ncbi:MAG: GAF domain-containing protein, partial [Anaerolineae bacterium]|nr:GAF domain-containing protein [Anaerolineae bacterium]
MISTQYSNIVSPGNGDSGSSTAPAWSTPTLDGKQLDRLALEIKEVTTLYNVGVAVGSSLNLKEVIWALYKESSRLIDTANFAIVIYDDQNDYLDFSLAFDQGNRCKPFSFFRPKSAGLINQIISTQSPVLVHDLIQTDTTVETDQFCPEQQTRAWLGVPIVNPALVNEGVLGAIVVWSYEPNIFNDHDLWLLSAIGTQAAIAIRNANLFEDSQRRAMEMAV